MYILCMFVKNVIFKNYYQPIPKLSPSRKLNISPNESGIRPAITVEV